MAIEILTRTPLRFYNKNGVKYFENFNAVDKLKRPVEISIDHNDIIPSIKAVNHQGRESLYDIKIDVPSRKMDGVVLNTEPQNRGIGEVLNLAAIIEFQQNNLNKFKIFSLRESIQFFTRYGFNLVTDDAEEILHNLRMVLNDKSEKFNSLKNKAKFFQPQIEKNSKTDPFVKQRACDVISKYLQALSKDHKKVNPYGIKYSSDMMLSDWDIEINREYLNSLMDLHEINYKV